MAEDHHPRRIAETLSEHVVDAVDDVLLHPAVAEITLGRVRADDVVRMVLYQSLPMIATGLTLGLLGGWLVAGLMRNLVFGISPLDAVTFLGVPTLLLLVAFAAHLVPAHRATRLAPMDALRTS